MTCIHPRAWRLGLAMLALATATATQAVTVSATPVDLPDTTPGQDLWRLDLVLQGSFSQSSTLTVAFSAFEFSDLKNLSPDFNLTWGVSVVQPNPAGLISGQWQARYFNESCPGNCSNLPPLTADFPMSFVWHPASGVAYPGQGPLSGWAFTYEPSGGVTQFGLVRVNAPVPLPVPEPHGAALLLSGLAAMAAWRRTRKA